MTLPYRDPVTGKVNPKSKSLDHATALANGGSLLDPANHRLAHLGCNSGRRDRDPQRIMRPSIDW